MKQTHFPWKMFTRIVSVQAFLVLIAVGASGLSARYFFKQQYLEQSESQLQTMLMSISHTLPERPSADWCARYSAGTDMRLSLIARDGKIFCDSFRSESASLQKDTPSTVADLAHGAYILRGSLALARLQNALQLFDASLAFVLLMIAVALATVAVWAGRRIVFPVGRLLLKAQNVLHPEQTKGEVHPTELGHNSYGELSELESSLDDIRRDLEAKSQSLTFEREEHATLMGAISDAILAVDLEGAPLFFNSRFMLLFSQEDLRSKNTRLWEMFRAPEILEAFRAGLKEGKVGEVRAIPLDQGRVKGYYSISVSPLRRSTGELYGAVGVFHDVTDLKRAEQIRIDFVANVSHELRTPLTAIKGYTETLLQDSDKGLPAQKDFLEIVLRNTGRLMSLINDLLDLSSLESNADTLQKTEVATEEMTSRVIKQLQGVLNFKNQKVSVVTTAHSVGADPRRLEQVLINLLDNASKYTPAGRTIEVRWEPLGTSDVLLKVIDTGPGIPPEHHARLFERFYRVDKARSRELGGTGLGLAIVKHIMQRHDGTIWIESVAGHGATFVCRFPNIWCPINIA